MGLYFPIANRSNNEKTTKIITAYDRIATGSSDVVFSLLKIIEYLWASIRNSDKASLNWDEREKSNTTRTNPADTIAATAKSNLRFNLLIETNLSITVSSKANGVSSFKAEIGIIPLNYLWRNIIFSPCISDF